MTRIPQAPIAIDGGDQRAAVGSSDPIMGTGDAAARTGVSTWSIIIVGEPGDGTLIMVDWLILACAGNGCVARAVPINAGVDAPHGMYLEVATTQDALEAMPGVPDRAVDIIVAGEHLEAVRAIRCGWADARRTTVIASCARSYTDHERAAELFHVLPEAELDALITRASREYIAFDGTEVAGWYGLDATALPGLLFGALVGSAAMPVDMGSATAAIRQLGIRVRPSLVGVRRGRPIGRRRGGRVRRTMTAQQFIRKRRARVPRRQRAAFEALVSTVESSFDADDHQVLWEAVARLIDFQDASYAEQFLEWCAATHRSVQAAQPTIQPAVAAAILPTVARNLASIMAYDDLPHIAHVKLARDRLTGIRRRLGITRVTRYDVTEHVPVEAWELQQLRPAWYPRQARAGSTPLDSSVRVHQVRTTTLAGIARLRRWKRLRRYRAASPRHALELDTAASYVECVCEILMACPDQAGIVAQSGALVAGYGSARVATREGARAWWGRIVRQALAIDRATGSEDMQFTRTVLPHIWKRTCESGQLALWEYAGQVVGVAMSCSRGADAEDALRWARVIVADA